MSTPGFQLYADKENVSSIGPSHKARGRHGIAPVQKIFGASGGKPGFPTPVRKALGDMNRNPHVATPTFTPKQKNLIGGEFKKPVSSFKSAGPTPVKRQPLSSRPVNIQIQDQAIKQKSKGPSCEISKPISKPKSIVPEEIEKGFIYKDREDDFEDILPKKERVSTYLEALISWRPPCFGETGATEEEEEEEWQAELARRTQDMDREQPHWPSRGDGEQQNSIEPLSCVENLPCPNLDDTPLPSLDESLDICEHIGPLTLKDD